MKESLLKEVTWSTQDLAFKVLKPGTKVYDTLVNAPRMRGGNECPATLLYDALALRYNEADPGDLMLVNLPNRPTASNLRKNLQARGVGEHDYRLFRPIYDENGERYPRERRPLALQRITNTPMTTVRPYPAIAAKLAKQAVVRGAEYNFSLHEAPAIPGPAEQIHAETQGLANT